MKRSWLMFGLAAVLLAGCGPEEGTEPDESSEGGSSEENEETAEVEPGGELDVAVSGQPETLDPHMTPATITRDIGRHIFEPLVTMNSNYEVEPVLAESYEESEDGETITFHLREGILFHNGEEMVADDVIASMEKWVEQSSLGRANLSDATWIAEDDYTVVLDQEEASYVTTLILADVGQFPAIMPEEVVADSEGAGVNEFIGTGPFEFVEWATDQYVHLQKYDDYQALSTPADGLAGEKEALVDDLYFTFVADASTRIAGLQTGEYDVIMQVPYDNADQIEADPNLVNYIAPNGTQTLVFNKQEGIFAEQSARQAVNTMLDKGAILTGTFTEEEFYDLEPSLMLEEQVEWYSEAGAEYYNQNDEELAQELLEESGYDGEEITLLTTRDYDHHYNTAVVVQQQLEQLGMNVNLEVVEWATVLENMENPEAYDLFAVSFATRTIPHQYPFLDSRAEWAGWSDHAPIDEQLDAINNSDTAEEALAAFGELQEEFYEYLPAINIGKFSQITSFNENVEGFDELVGPIFWNVYKDE